MASVLVIDDSEEIREMIKLYLSEEGFEVQLADSPEEALEKCTQFKFDVVLCDLVMPVGDDPDSGSAMTGVHAIHQIAEKYPDVPVIAMSGHLTGEPLKVISKFKARGALSKPFKQEELIRVIKNAMGQPA